MNIGELKKKYERKTVILCGSAPSLNIYAQKPFEDGYHIALNKAFQKSGIRFDAVICCDYTAIRDAAPDLMKRDDLIKFLGISPGPPDTVLPDAYFEGDNLIRFEVKNQLNDYHSGLSFETQADIMPLTFAESVATVAMQILLWCQPRKLYLVGLDFSQAGHYEEVNSSDDYLRMHHEWAAAHWKLESIRTIWKNLRDFAYENYPETEIISVNPVSLRGIFEDYCYRQ